MNAAEYYQSLTTETVSCSLCGSGQTEPLFRGDRYGMGLTFTCCSNCGLVFVNPRPVPEEMARFYRDMYRRFYESVERPTQEYIQNGIYLQRAQYAIEMIRPFFQPSPGACSMDIGCAEGSLMRELNRVFPDMVRCGIEPDTQFASFATVYGNADVFNGSWEDFLQKDSRIFDLVTLVHVLEHSLDPQAFLGQIRSRMQDDAIAYIEVPNTGAACGLPQMHLAHLFLFYKETFLSLLERCGFEIVDFCEAGLPSLCPSMAAVVRKGDPKPVQTDTDAIACRLAFIKKSLEPGVRS